ncbi:hypothetical protein BD410DRAFT_515410 [Rickenella mellea]|uniref:F-box domain-containing protein n=1 Tax=Rickenella mellea TaxID=50990 RepID=A0A4Y7PRB9_9AGAM|nr:hypothetical protein BD410DRAFT_515410 [Rickenella mellea]
MIDVAVQREISTCSPTLYPTMDPPHIPPEIWRNIFRFATFTATSLNMMDWGPYWPYARLVDVHPTKSYHSTLPTKKAITLVSRHFRELSLEYLFEVVQLFHTHNAQLLLYAILSHATVTGTPSSPARWIKYMTVDLDTNEDSHLMDGVLMKIFPRCENLVAFGWESHERLLDFQTDDSSELMASIPLNITTLEWHRNVLGHSFNSLRGHVALRNLRVSDVLSMSPADCDVTIPSITHLDARTPLTSIAVSWWDLPSVVHLTLDCLDGHHFERLVSKSRDTIESIYIPDPWRCRLDGFPRILASMPKLRTFYYDIDVNTDDQDKLSSTWIHVGAHASLTHVYLFCRTGMHYGKGSFSAVRDLFLGHLQPLLDRHLPLTIAIMGAQSVFEQGDFREDGYDSAAQERFFYDLSASLNISQVRITVQ